MEKKSDVFTIEHYVNFYPAENLLKNKENGKQMQLNWPTSCCLLLLIKQHGETITAATFMQQVWGSKNIVISKNTLIKNISLLRSALVYLGLPKTLLSTINGEGYKIPLRYHIVAATEEATVKQQPTSTPSNSATPEKKSIFTVRRWKLINRYCRKVVGWLFYLYR